MSLNDVVGGVSLSEKVRTASALQQSLSDIRRFVDDDSKLPVRPMKMRLVRKLIIDMVAIGEIRQQSDRYNLLNIFYREMFGVDAPYYTGNSCVIEKGQ